MALETLKDVKEIGGFPVFDTHDPQMVMTDPEWKEFTKSHPIWIDHEKNEIGFRIQNGAIKENGVNGCQVDTIIEAAKMMVEGLNKNFPCEENELAINKLDMALAHLAERTKDREARGVEGTSNT